MPVLHTFAAQPSNAAGAVVATANQPAQTCVRSDADTRRALQQGTTRVVVVVRGFQPVVSGNSALVVSLLSANKTERHEVGRFAVHPLRAFSAKDPHKQKQFLLTLNEQAHLLGNNDAICFEVGFDSRQGNLKNGKLEFHIELVEVQTKPAQ